MADNINNIGPIIPQNLSDVSANKNTPKTGNNDANEGGVIRDRVEISNEAQNITRALAQINAATEIRTDMVEKAIEERILENRRVPSYQLAAKLLLEDSIE